MPLLSSYAIDSSGTGRRRLSAACPSPIRRPRRHQRRLIQDLLRRLLTNPKKGPSRRLATTASAQGKTAKKPVEGSSVSPATSNSQQPSKPATGTSRRPVATTGARGETAKKPVKGSSVLPAASNSKQPSKPTIGTSNRATAVTGIKKRRVLPWLITKPTVKSSRHSAGGTAIRPGRASPDSSAVMKKKKQVDTSTKPITKGSYTSGLNSNGALPNDSSGPSGGAS